MYTQAQQSPYKKYVECIINNKNSYDLWDMVHTCMPAQNSGEVLLVLSKYISFFSVLFLKCNLPHKKGSNYPHFLLRSQFSGAHMHPYNASDVDRGLLMAPHCSKLLVFIAQKPGSASAHSLCSRYTRCFMQCNLTIMSLLHRCVLILL